LNERPYAEVPDEFLKVQGKDETLLMVPGEYRTSSVTIVTG